MFISSHPHLRPSSLFPNGLVQRPTSRSAENPAFKGRQPQSYRADSPVDFSRSAPPLIHQRTAIQTECNATPAWESDSVSHCVLWDPARGQPEPSKAAHRRRRDRQPKRRGSQSPTPVGSKMNKVNLPISSVGGTIQPSDPPPCPSVRAADEIPYFPPNERRICISRVDFTLPTPYRSAEAVDTSDDEGSGI